MKVLASIIALALAVAFTVPAFAQGTTPTNKADCEKAEMKWNATTNRCEKKM